MGDTKWSALGFCINLLAALFVVLAFATPYWIEPDEGKETATQLERLGLWEICFDGYSDIRDGLGRIYNGCWWIFAREYDNIRPYIIKDWFAASQALMTVNMILALITVLVGIMLLLKCLPKKAQKYSSYFVAVASTGIGVMSGVTLYFFGVHAEQDTSWLKQPRFRHLSWSFWCAMCGGLLYLLGAVFYCVYSLKLYSGGQRSTAYRAHELRHYRNDRYFR